MVTPPLVSCSFSKRLQFDHSTVPSSLVFGVIAC